VCSLALLQLNPPALSLITKRICALQQILNVLGLMSLQIAPAKVVVPYTLKLLLTALQQMAALSQLALALQKPLVQLLHKLTALLQTIVLTLLPHALSTLLLILAAMITQVLASLLSQLIALKQQPTTVLLSLNLLAHALQLRLPKLHVLLLA